MYVWCIVVYKTGETYCAHGIVAADNDEKYTGRKRAKLRERFTGGKRFENNTIVV